MMQELKKKSHEELGQLIMALKMQLLQMRFKAAEGETKNLHQLKGIRKLIAACQTALTQQGIKTAFCLAGIQLIDVKTNQIKLISAQNSKLPTTSKSSSNPYQEWLKNLTKKPAKNTPPTAKSA